MKKLLSLVILSIIGSNVWAYCPINLPSQLFHQCLANEQSQQRQQQQMDDIQQQLQELNMKNNMYQQRCFRNYFGAVQCY